MTWSKDSEGFLLRKRGKKPGGGATGNMGGAGSGSASGGAGSGGGVGSGGATGSMGGAGSGGASGAATGSLGGVGGGAGGAATGCGERRHAGHHDFYSPESPHAGSVLIPLTFRSFGGDGGHLVVETWWKELPVPLILDTGSTHSLLHTGLFLLDDTSARSARKGRGRGIGGLAEAVLVVGGGGSVSCSQEPMLVAGMRIGVAELPPLSWGLIDLGPIRNQYRENGYPPPCGLIGLDMLRRMNAVIHCHALDLFLKILPTAP